MEREIHPYDPNVWDGPWVGAATFCDRLLLEEEGFYSIIRMVDSVTADPAQPSAAGVPAPMQLDLILFIMLRSGVKPSHSQLRVRRNAPNGTAGMTPSQMVDLPGDGMSVPIQISFHLDFDMPGRYWFDIMLDDLIMSRVPLLVKINQPTNAEVQSEGNAP